LDSSVTDAGVTILGITKNPSLPMFNFAPLIHIPIPNQKGNQTINHYAARRVIDKSWSKHDIDNACMNLDLPISDQIHGIFQMTPPERLHSTQEVLTKYMMDSL
jgi:hypothetical protein